LGGIIQEFPSLRKTKARSKPMTNQDWSVELAGGGAGGRAPDSEGPELFGDEVDDALLGLEGRRHAEERGGLGEDARRR